MLAVEHQHRFAVWGGAGNRTLALTSTASRAATDTSATVVLVWVLGFEPRASSVQGRHSDQAELHPDLSVTSFRSPFRLSAWLSLFRPVGRGRDQAPSSSLPGAPRISWRGWQELHSWPFLGGRSFWRRRHPSGLTHACLGSPARLRTWSGRINGPAPVPTGTPRNKKTPLFRAGLHEDSTVVSCYSMESLHAGLSSLDRTSSHKSWRTSATGDGVPAGRGVMRYVAVCFITGPRKIGPLI